MRSFVPMLLLSAIATAPLAAQTGADAAPPESLDTWVGTQRRNLIQYFRPYDQRGLNVFETSKVAGPTYRGFALQIGAAFTQQFQNLSHENTAAPRVVGGVDQNRLKEIGPGFNNATANLFLDAQLAKGIRVSMTSYLSSRHHNETWVKDGFLQIDASPIRHPVLDRLMQDLTLKVGHFEVNYGDFHYRRTDNGQALWNPFVGNLVLESFTTEVGGELQYKPRNGFLATVAVTNGEIRGTTANPKERTATYIGKVGFDRTWRDGVRTRLTGSLYTTASSANNTLYSGDRAGSRYYFVVENTAATEAAQFTSGRFNPGFRDKVEAVMINPFVQLGALELFGVIEQASGRAAGEARERDVSQVMGEAVLRGGPDRRFFGGARYTVVDAELAGATITDVSIDRVQIGGGWFITPGVLAKVEWVAQRYRDFPTTDIRNGAKFRGVMIEGVVVF
jgi:hypothetical protein